MFRLQLVAIIRPYKKEVKKGNVSNISVVGNLKTFEYVVPLKRNIQEYYN